MSSVILLLAGLATTSTDGQTAQPAPTPGEPSASNAAAAGPVSGPAGDTPTTPPPAHARLPDDPDLLLRVELFGGYQPKALALRLLLLKRIVLWNDHSMLLDRTYLSLGAGADITPPFTRPFVTLEWLPLQALRLRVDYGLLLYTGWVGLIRWPNTSADWRESNREASPTETVLGQSLRLAPEVRLKVGRWVLVSLCEIDYRHLYVDTPVDGEMLFEPWYGLPAQAEDWTVVNRLVTGGAVIDAPGELLVLGAVWDYRRSMRLGIENQRLAAAGLYQTRVDLGPLQRLAFVLFAGVHAEEKYLQWRPYVLGGVSTTWVLGGG